MSEHKINKCDEWVNDSNGAWFRVTKVETTKRKGDVVRFTYGIGATRGKRKKVGQHSQTLDAFTATMAPLRKVEK